MKTFVKVTGIMALVIGGLLTLLVGVATINTVREHSDAIHEIDEKLRDTQDRINRMEEN